MNDHSLFLGKFLRHGTAIASVAPSSHWLAQTTLRHVDWATARVVVELGAGTGPITRLIAEKADRECRVVVIERDHDFSALLRERFGTRPGFEIVEGDVGDLASILSAMGIGRADAIISGLPLPSFPRALQGSFFKAVGAVLAPRAFYSQITEIPWLYWGFYRRYFEEVRFAFEPRNIPPAGAYFCRGVKGVA